MDDRRRDFLKAASFACAASLLSPAMARALATPARRVHGSIQDVQHVVILMQENRSFDHYFGCLRGVRGYGDPRPLTLPSGKSVFHQPREGGVEAAVLPFRLNSESTSAECMASLDHTWKGQHSLWRNHDAWIPVKGPLTMGYFTREDIPYYYALADAFTVCDAYHCSIFGPTNPNRLFLFTGTSGLTVGAYGLQIVANDDDGNWTADASRDKPDFAGYGWTTYAERLQKAGVSWKLYQEYDNFGDNSLAFFKAFRGLDPSSPLHRGGRAWVEGSNAQNGAHSYGEHLVSAFAKDVAADALPQVSWLVAPTKASEHPDASPGYGEAFTARLIEALASNPEVFAKTVFLLTYDENDGFFDHAAPPIPAVSPTLGATTVSFTGEDFGGTPVGLGPRVPFIAVSPWSRGGFVNSQVFDHTSVIRFLEARFGVAEPNISPWRRAVTGDLTSVFDFAGAQGFPPALPSTRGVAAQVDAACKLASPAAPERQALPTQEAGVRPARPLPYVFHVGGRAQADGFRLTIDNPGAAGICLHAQTTGAVLGPWTYTVEGGKSLTAVAPVVDKVSGRYELTVYGPNGFMRAFKGAGPSEPGVEARYEPDHHRLVLRLRNDTPTAQDLVVSPGPYLTEAPRRYTLAPGAAVEDAWLLTKSGCWYDLAVTAPSDPNYLRRLAGHMETTKASVSDPAMAKFAATAYA
jgi:phospholipase C